MPPLPSGRAVDVRVLLAPGVRPAGAGIPALSWTERDGRWLGTGSYDAVPDVIVVPDYFGAPAVRARWQRRVSFVAGGVALAGLIFFAARRRRDSPVGPGPKA